MNKALSTFKFSRNENTDRTKNLLIEMRPRPLLEYIRYLILFQSIWIKDLKQTAGEESRETQMKESQPEITDPFWKSGLMCKFKSEKDGTEQQGLVCTLALNDKEEKIAKVRVGEDDNLIDVLLTSLEKVVVDGKNSEFENWTLGDDCRALFEVDGLEYEGKGKK